MSIIEMEAKIREMRQLQALIAEAEAEIEAIKDQIKAEMGETETLLAGEYKVTWKAVTFTKLDTASLKKELPEIAEQFSVQTTTRRFNVA